MELEPLTVEKRKQVTLVIDAAGQMLDVDTVVKCIKGVYYENQAPRDLFSFVGVVPSEDDRTFFKLEGSVCMFMPQPGTYRDDPQMPKLLLDEEACVKEFLA